MDKPIQPVLLGADMNCYSMARAFHEAYGVKSRAFGRWPMGETKYSRIVQVSFDEKLNTDAVLLKTLSDYAAANPAAHKILLGCTDDYAAMIIRHRAALEKDYIVPYIGAELADRLVSKDRFYQYCAEYAIPYPKTFMLHGPGDLPVLPRAGLGWPLVLKPASSIEYWKHPFDGMKKVYTADNAAAAEQITRAIFAGGYGEALIAQEYIPGADDGMRVLTAYCDKDAKVKMLCLGHVLLEEHTPKALGNHAAIITEVNRPLMDSLARFLEAIGYTGFANFDVKYDPRDGQYKVFEINLRQGRSNYYVTGAGCNLARLLVEDRVLGRDLGKPVLVPAGRFWHSIPTGVVWRYTADEALAQRAVDAVAAKQDTTTLGYPYDVRLNPLRRLYLWEHGRRYFQKYATYCTKYRN